MGSKKLLLALALLTLSICSIGTDAQSSEEDNQNIPHYSGEVYNEGQDSPHYSGEVYNLGQDSPHYSGEVYNLGQDSPHYSGEVYNLGQDSPHYSGEVYNLGKEADEYEELEGLGRGVKPKGRYFLQGVSEYFTGGQPPPYYSQHLKDTRNEAPVIFFGGK